MSLITRCPACQTLFKVVPDQLRISEGWVRCGQCAAIFDASLHLLPQDADGAPASTPADNTNEAPPESAPVLPDPVVSPDPVAQTESDERQDSDPLPESVIESGEVSFLRKQHDGFRWRKPIMRVGLIFLSLALLLGLVGQIVFHERDRLLALKPDLRPWLLAFCAPLHCTLSPLQQKDSVVIDSASFTKLRENTYRLNFSLRNSASVALAIPAIELTLTDSRDQPVVRRVFRTAELGAKSDALAAGSEWQSSLTVGANDAGKTERIVGYSLYAFYP